MEDGTALENTSRTLGASTSLRLLVDRHLPLCRGGRVVLEVSWTMYMVQLAFSEVLMIINPAEAEAHGRGEPPRMRRVSVCWWVLTAGEDGAL